MNTNDYTYLAHHGILGMKWGVRRYQNEDGSYTEAGKRRYIRENRETIVNDYKDQYGKNYRTEKASAERKKKTLIDKANKLYETHSFDYDDGGGGKTEEDRKAGKRYMDIYDEVTTIDGSIRSNAIKKTEEYIQDKYGDLGIRALNYDRKRNTAKALAVVGAVEGLALGTLAVMIAKAPSPNSAQKAKN